jgi:hypothetical protein
MGFGFLFPAAGIVPIGETFVFVHIDVSVRDVCIVEPDL